MQNMRSEDLCAMKVKPMLSVRTCQSRCLLFPWCTRAPLQVAGVALCIHEHGSLLSTACVFSLAWFVLLSAEDGLTWLSVIVWFTTHLLLLISQLLLSGMLREILFSQGGLSFLFTKKLHELTSLNPPNYFVFLWLGSPSVPSGNIFQHWGSPSLAAPVEGSGEKTDK